MNKSEFQEEIGKLQITYNKKYSQEELKIWFEEFKKVDIKEFKKAIEKTIKELSFIPKIADIRSRIAVNSNDYYVNDRYRHLYKNLEWGEFVD